MNRSSHTILRLVLVLILAMLGMAQARAQADTVCAGGVSTWVIENVPGDSYEWTLYNDATGINFATDPGNCPATEAYFVGGVNTGDSVNVMCLVPGTYFIMVMATNECPTNNLKVGMIVVIGCLSYAEFIDPEPVCSGDTAMLTVDIAGGIGPWIFTYTDGTNTWTDTTTVSPYTFPLIPTPAAPGTYQYWITSVTNGYGMINTDPSDPINLIVKPKPATSQIYRYTP